MNDVLGDILYYIKEFNARIIWEYLQNSIDFGLIWIYDQFVFQLKVFFIVPIFNVKFEFDTY